MNGSRFSEEQIISVHLARPVAVFMGSTAMVDSMLKPAARREREACAKDESSGRLHR